MRKKIIIVLTFILISNFLVPAHSSGSSTRTLNICANPFVPTDPPCIQKFWAFGTDHTSSFGGGNSLTSPFWMSVSYTDFFGIQVGIGSSQGSGTPDPSTISVENRYVEVILNLGTAAENNNFVSGYAGNYSSNGYYAISSGELTSLSHSINGDGDLIVTIKTIPYKVSRVVGIDGVTCWVGSCTATTAKFTQFESLVTLLPVGSGYGHVFTIPLSFANGYLSTDAESANIGSFSGKLSFRTANVHFQSDGVTEQSGFYKTFIPKNALIDVFGNWSRISGLTTKASILRFFKLQETRGGVLRRVEASLPDQVDVGLDSTGVILKFTGYTYSTLDFNIESDEPTENSDSSSNSSGGGSVTPSITTNFPIESTQFNLSNPLKVKDSFFKSLDANQIGSISVSQFAKLPVKTISLLSPSQADALTFDQLKALKPSQVVALKPSVIAVLDSNQIAALEPADFKLMKTTQIARISAEAAAGLAKSDLNAFSQTQLRSLTTNAVKNLKPEVLKSLSANKLRQFSTRQISALTDEQKSVLTKTQKSALRIK
jgi:hypothetical protein